MKVYCLKCEYYGGGVHSQYDYCEAPDNLIKYDTYLCEKVEYKNAPEDINKNNNCSWFKAMIVVDLKQ